jgi:hypothetical protein
MTTFLRRGEGTVIRGQDLEIPDDERAPQSLVVSPFTEGWRTYEPLAVGVLEAVLAQHQVLRARLPEDGLPAGTSILDASEALRAGDVDDIGRAPGERGQVNEASSRLSLLSGGAGPRVGYRLNLTLSHGLSPQ